MNDRKYGSAPHGPLVVRLDEEEYDISNCDEFFKALEPTFNAPDVIVDMSAVRYMDSTCLSKLTIMRTKRGEAGFPPARIVITSRTVRRLFQLTGFDRFWPIFDSLEGALEAN
jgi:anti-anti-sigma factor